MDQVSKYRVLRLRCQIPLGEIASLVNISHQRLSQLELRRMGGYPQNPEKLIVALELVIQRKKRALERAEEICRQERETLFHYTQEDEEL